ncbi:EamA family transporter [Thermosulfurimonas marina]|uniref:EamA family transporter n=1 Tax=Thermosulfurimonas marina TaxID=2047767 RepID=A0A6H1WT66_9BACT|nr:DMT family transporter [Thermosulfurimonas marina]QJA06344.1 EamA family transporter [Thermosulfurimonas marina]
MGLWLILALGAAFFVALGDFFNKKYFATEGMAAMALVRTLAPVPFLLGVIFLKFEPGPYLYFTLEVLKKPAFLLTLAALLPLEISALFLYMEAIRVSPLSLTLPLLAFTPAFLIGTGFLLLGERPSALGVAGILFVVLGSYLLHLPHLSEGPLAPLKGLLRERGSLLMLAVAALYAVTSALGKRAILLSSPLWFASFYFILLGLVVPLLLRILSGQKILPLFRRRPLGFFLLGLSQALMVVCHMQAISLAPAAYMIAVKRTSILFGVFLGGAFLRERHFGIRFLASAVMVGGVFLLALTQK